MNEKSAKNTSEGDKTTIDLKKNTAFLKKSKKYAEIYIKQKKDNVMKKILKASNYEKAKELVGQSESAVKNWSDVMRLNILLNLIVKHSKNNRKDKCSGYIFNLKASNMKAQTDLPDEFKIGKDTPEEKANYKKNPLHLLITGVDRLLKQKRANEAYDIIMKSGDNVEFTSKRDKLKHALGKVTQAELECAKASQIKANKILFDMLERLLKAECTSEFDGIIKEYDQYDSREFDIVRSFVSMFPDNDLLDDQTIKKLYNKLCKLGTLCDNSLYSKLYDLYFPFLNKYVEKQIESTKTKDVDKILKIEINDVKDVNDSDLKVIINYIKKLIELPSKIKFWNMPNGLKNDLAEAQTALSNIFEKEKEKDDIVKFYYASNSESNDNNNISLRLNSIIYNQISPLFGYVQKIVNLSKYGTNDSTDICLIKTFEDYKNSIPEEIDNIANYCECVKFVISAFDNEVVKEKYQTLSSYMTTTARSFSEKLGLGTTRGCPDPPYKFSKKNIEETIDGVKLFDKSPKEFIDNNFKKTVGLEGTKPPFYEELLAFIKELYEQYFNWYVVTRKSHDIPRIIKQKRKHGYGS